MNPVEEMSNLDSPPPAAERCAVAIVAPEWLQDGLAVLAKTIPRVRLVACTSSISVLLLLEFEHAPDVFVLSVDPSKGKATNQIRQVKFVYPRARYLVLIQEPVQSAVAHAAGADETLLQGASAEQFFAAIGRLVARQATDKQKAALPVQPSP